MSNPSWRGGQPSGLSDCSNASLDHSLLRQARRRVVRRSCTGLLRFGRAVEFFLFDSAVWPPDPSPFSPSFVTRTWLARLTSGTTIQCGPSVNASNLPVRSAPGSLPLLLADFAFSHVRHLSLKGQQQNSFRKQVRAGYAALAEVAHSLRRQGARPVTLLNFGVEACDIPMVRIVENLLSSCGINPNASILLHYGVGAMLPLHKNFMLPQGSMYLSRHWQPLLRWADAHLPARARTNLPTTRLRQAFWNVFWNEMAEAPPRSELHQDLGRRQLPFVERYRVCDANSTALLHRVLQRLREPAQKPFLLLGGRAKDERGLITLELQRIGLLDHALWSAGRFGFCPLASGGPMPQGTCQGSHSDHCSLGREWRDGPFATPQARALLRDEQAVRRLCDQLPKVLDVDPTKKLSVTESVRGDAGSSLHALWRGAGVGVIMETNIRDALVPDAKETSHPSVVTYVTEKPLKPILHLRPAVHLGAAGALATLSSFGFDASFGGLVNTSYDTLKSGSARTSAALDELTRLTRLSPHELLKAAPSLANALVGNLRQLVCGGLQREMLAHAQQAVELADRMARGGFARE